MNQRNHCDLWIHNTTVGMIQIHVLMFTISQCSGNITRIALNLQQHNCKQKQTLSAVPFNRYSLSTYFADSKSVRQMVTVNLSHLAGEKKKICRYDYFIAQFS